jgi:tetratricopeptide (TPR) repeat protein
MLFAAYEAFLQGDPQTALLEADRMLQTLRRLGVSGWTSSQLGGLYLALGKFQVAQELSKGNSRNSLFLAGVAYLKGEDGAMKKHLREYLESGGGDRVLRGGGNPMFGPLSPILLVRAGLLSEAEKILHLLGDRLSGKRAKEIQIPLGALALSRGNITEGMAMIENTLPLVNRPGTAGTYFLGCEILAKAWRLQGDLDKAVQLLEEASEKKSLLRAQAGLPVPLWMGLRLQLAQLYREMDRSAEARKIEDELRNLLAYADPDHPILRQLDHSEEIALLEPAN